MEFSVKYLIFWYIIYEKIGIFPEWQDLKNLPWSCKS